MSATASAAHVPSRGIPQRDEIGRELQATLRELIERALVGKQLHWSVAGPLFRPLHLSLDELVGAWNDLAPTIVVRAVALGSWPDGQAAAVVAAGETTAIPRGAIADHAVVCELTQRLAGFSGTPDEARAAVGYSAKGSFSLGERPRLSCVPISSFPLSRVSALTVSGVPAQRSLSESSLSADSDLAPSVSSVRTGSIRTMSAA